MEGNHTLLTSTAFANSMAGLDRIHFIQTQDTLLKGELQNLKVQDRVFWGWDVGLGVGQ